MSMTTSVTAKRRAGHAGHSRTNSLDDGNQSSSSRGAPAAKRTRNRKPCGTCASAQLRCEIDAPYSRDRCARCTKMGLDKCPPHIPRAVRVQSSTQSTNNQYVPSVNLMYDTGAYPVDPTTSPYMPQQMMQSSQTSSPESVQQLSLPYSQQDYNLPAQDPYNGMMYAVPSPPPMYPAEYTEPTATSMSYLMGNGISQNDAYTESYYSHGHLYHGQTLWGTAHYH